MTIARVLAACLLTVLFSGCSWVDIKPQGEKVRVLAPQEVTHCRYLGPASSKTLAVFMKVFARSRDKVQEEVNRLARNTAGEMGGDSIVPTGPLIDGEQAFNVYRCINP